MSVYAYLNDEGEFISDFRIYKYLNTFYEETDLEEKEYLKHIKDFQPEDCENG